MDIPRQSDGEARVARNGPDAPGPSGRYGLHDVFPARSVGRVQQFVAEMTARAVREEIVVKFGDSRIFVGFPDDVGGIF